MAAAGRVGRLRTVHDRLQCGGRVAGGQTGASPAAGRAYRLLRAHHATAAHLPHRHPFRPVDEGDAAGHGCAVAALAEFLSRAFRFDRLADRTAAAVAVYQLAAGSAAVHPLRGLHRADHAGGAKDLQPADAGGGTLRRPRGPRVRRARQRGTGAELRAGGRRGAGTARRRRQVAVGAIAGAVMVGAGGGDDPAHRPPSRFSRSSWSASSSTARGRRASARS